ncbi:hypothetical protein G6027_01235 [Dietzia sp. SLG310A2-38A2]|uniref:hypothetical protein n=1 Tax=Dietzia sp. SLG310A2-38A2 TaxID=1630643 RepID=UPI0015FD2D7B|nr:hypothetical protein [Dietzia sp. SLG310A2-38A2]MBB1029535.1 hypothetical protein [Dietzia sp. SLG310A2-38A2]
MARTWHPSARFAALGIAAAFAVAAAPAATAQIPGNNPRTTVFPVDDPRVQIAVDPLDPGTGTVRVVVQNNTSSNISCTGLDGGPAATVTTAEVVARSVDFYTQYPQSGIADLVLQIPEIGDQVIPLGSVADQAGSLGEFINPEWQALSETGEVFQQARLAGHYGVIPSPLAIPAEQATERVVRLDHPSEGQRVDFQTGVFLTCVLSGQRYAFHAYEGDVKPAYGTNDSTGSLGSAGLGS